MGHNLTIASEQDRETYDSKQQNTSAGAGYTVGGAATASVSASRDQMNSDWQSVTEQSGIFAGSGGFDITVGEHTQLDGAVIASTADSSLNKLDTGTLGWRDIDNHAEYEVEHVGAGVSTGGTVLDQFKGNMANGVLAGLNGSDSADSTTKAAVSEGTITVRDRENQTQDVAELSRDVENANPGLEQIFDKEKEQNRLKAAQLIAEIGSKAMDIARTEGQIAGEKAKQDPQALVAARAELAGKGKLNPTADEIAKQAYDTAMKPFGTGSALQQGLQAATAAIQGLAGGSVAQAVSGAAAPYLAEQIHRLTTDANGKVNTEANLMAHAVVGAVTAYAAGNSALAGASGAAMGEYIAQQLYPDVKREDLSEEQRQTISALGTLAAGLAGGVAGDSTADAVAGAQAGKNAVENNALGGCSPVTCKQGLDVIGGGGSSSLGGGMIGGGAGVGLAAVIGEIFGGGSEDAESKPNAGKDLTDAEKAELGGAGSGTGTPPPPENDPNQQSNKPVQKLNQKQESSIKKIDNLIKNSVKDHDITGTLKDMDGNPIIKPDSGGKYWNHMKEMQDTLNGLRNHANTLKNVNNPEAQAAYGRATDAINKLESAIKGYGI